MESHHVTMRDVAAVAGVSVSTVSRALKGSGRMSEETRRRVFAAAQRLEFHPNALAQSFATGRSLIVGVLTNTAAGTFARPVIAGIVSALSAHDIAVIVYDDESDPASRPGNLRKLRARHVDGVLVVGDGTDHAFSSITASVAAPVVYAFAVSDRQADRVLLPDDRRAGRLVGEHLVGTGRRHIAHITAAATSRAVREREAGFLAAIKEAGQEPVMPVRYGDWTRSWGSEAGRELDLDRVDAVFCGNDFIATGLLRTLIRRGVRVPDDIAVVGYDNWAKYGLQDDFLTTVDPELDRLGQRAAHRLVDAAGGAVDEGRELAEVTLVPGVSTGAISGEDLPFYPV